MDYDPRIHSPRRPEVLNDKTMFENVMGEKVKDWWMEGGDKVKSVKIYKRQNPHSVRQISGKTGISVFLTRSVQ